MHEEPGIDWKLLFEDSGAGIELELGCMRSILMLCSLVWSIVRELASCRGSLDGVIWSATEAEVYAVLILIS